METRFFTALLARIRGGSLAGEEILLPLSEILVPSRRRPSDEDYEAMVEMLQQLTQPRLLLDSLLPLSSALPLLAYAHHEKHHGVVRARLSPELLPYFGESTADEIRAPREQLLKLKTPAAYHFYWLMKECAVCGIGLIELSQIAWQLGVLTTKSASKFNPSGFYSRLRLIQQQVVSAGLSCVMSVTKRGKRLHSIRILFPSLPGVCSAELALSAELNQDGINPLLEGLLLFFRFAVGAVCAVAAAATTAAG